MSATPPRAGMPADASEAAGFLANLTQEFASSLHIDETLRHAINRFIVHLNAEAASIFLLDEADGMLVCRECVGPVDIRGLRLAPDQGIVGQTVQHNEAKIVRDVSKNPSFAAAVDADTGFATRSILCAPLAVRGKCLGALELMNKRGGDGLFDLNDLQLVTTVAAAAALAIHNAQLALDLVEQERVRKELELARQIQESLLPENPGNHFPVHGLNIPAREVSGDFYDFKSMDDGRIYFALADVSGKGMNAALLMAKTTSVLRCLARSAPDAGTLLRWANNEICETSTMGMFVTVIVGYLDRASGQVQMANGGHQPALVRRGVGHYDEIGAEAPPLGVVADIEFPLQELMLDGGAIYLYTDGLSESVAADGHELDVDGMKQMIESATSTNVAARLERIVDQWRVSGYQSHDDITVMVVETNG